MNGKLDKWFEETAADPVRRRAAIVGFTKQRLILVCCALVVTGCAVVMHFTAVHSPMSSLIQSFAALMAWVLVIRVNSRIRVLKLLERLSPRDQKPEDS